MSTHYRLRHLGTVIAIGATAQIISTAAEGSGFALLEQSASRLGTAFAGTGAAADDATTIFYNPAGLVHLDQVEAMIVVSGVDLGSQFRNANSLPALGQPLGEAGSDAGAWSALPAAYFAFPVNRDLAFGLAFNVPFGLKLEYDAGWIGRFQALKSEIKTYSVNPAVSFRLNDHVSLGFGLNYQRLQAELTNSVNYTAVVAQGLQQLVAAGQLPALAVPGLISANSGLEGHAAVRGDDSQWGFNAGVLFEFTPNTRLGLSYRSRITYQVEGSAKFEAPTATSVVGAGIIAAASAPGGALANSLASVDLELPDIANASFYQRIGDKVELLADVAWTGWSSVQELRVVRDTGEVLSVTPEQWKDTWRYALGATFKVGNAWKLRGGIALDESAVPSATRTPRLPDAERKWVAIGAQWAPENSSLRFDLGYAHLFSDDVSINQNDGSTLANGLLNGKQESDVNIVSLQLGYRF